MSEDNSTGTGHKVWSGTLSFGLVSTPIALYAAARSESVSFNMLHSQCNRRIKQQLHCPTCESTITRNATVKGYELRKDEFVTVTDAELKAIAPRSSHTLEITNFVPAGDVDAIYFESSYFLAVTEGGEKPFALIREAMIFKDVVAIAKLFYTNKQHLAVVRAVPGGLMLHTLFWSHEVRAFAYPRLPEVSDKELSIACQLIDALGGKFQPESFEDEYRAKVLQMIQRKAAGEAVTAEPVPEKKPPVTDLSAALMASIAAAQRKPAAVAGGVQ